MANMNIGEVLKSFRKCSGITQSEFANKINVSQSLISRLEKNEVTPTLEILDKYSEFFHVKTWVILQFREDDSKSCLTKKVEDLLFRKIVYNPKKDPFIDSTEL